MCNTKIHFFITVILNTLIIHGCNKPRVITPLGIIEGYWAKTVNNRTYGAFDGIPYALPPIGENRFEEPQPSEPWVGIWKADSEYKCLQYNHYTEPGEDFVIGDEDCLYLNVYTPEINSTKSYEVIVYIHGGAFMFNSASVYGHKYILDRDIVYVSLNYRLGPLGFLSTEDEFLPGNIGLKDQLMALKWINKYIQYFSGNPNSVTLTGMSAGGASVHLHYLSPLSRGLFHRGIVQSGTALNNWVMVENSLEKARKLGSIVGCNFKQSKALVDCLKTRPARQIVNSVKYFLAWLYNPFSPFGVVVDRFSKDPVVPDHPYILLKERKIKHLPIIFSCVQSEGLYPAADFIRDPDYLKVIDTKWNDVIPYILDYNNTTLTDKKQYISNKIRKFYFGDKKINEDTFPLLVKMITDRLFISDIELAVKLQATASNASIYFYYFTYRGAHSKSELRSKTNENFGVSHGDDTVYILSSNVNTRTTSSDIKMTEVLLNMWASYAKTNTPKLANIEWIPVNKDIDAKIQYASITAPNKLSMKTTDSLGNRKFWSSLGFLENENLFKVKNVL